MIPLFYANDDASAVLTRFKSALLELLPIKTVGRLYHHIIMYSINMFKNFNTKRLAPKPPDENVAEAKREESGRNR